MIVGDIYCCFESGEVVVGQEISRLWAARWRGGVVARLGCCRATRLVGSIPTVSPGTFLLQKTAKIAFFIGSIGKIWYGAKLLFINFKPRCDRNKITCISTRRIGSFYFCNN